MLQNVVETRSKLNDGCSEILREAASFFQDQGISMTSAQGMQEILSEQTLFNEYKARLLEGMEAEDAENFSQLLDNSRMEILRESSVAGIQQVAGLSMPTLRKMWARVALKHAIPTQVVATPRFLVSYTKAYLMDAQGVKHELPDAINALDNTRMELPKVSTTPIVLPVEDESLFAHSADANFVPSADHHDTIDKVFFVEKVLVQAPTLTVGTQTYTGDDVELRVHIKSDQWANIHGKIHIPVQHLDTTTGEVVKYGEVVDTLFGNINYSTGEFTCLSTKGLVKSVVLDARFSQEMNEYGESVSFEVLTKDITVGIGTHLNAPLPIEWLADTMAIYNIDGAAEVVDIMSQTVAQKLEIEIYNFLKKSVEINNVPYIGEFNTIPSAGYNGSPKSWREELKTVFDWFATKMKKDSKFHSGKFVIIGSPVDLMLLPNVDWVFNHTSEQMAGVDVSFNLGAFSGQNRYEIVSSELLPEGSVLMFFVPGTDRMLTYKYYPYTFNVERGYRDPNAPNVPSIMMTKRHVIEEFTPLICQINIKNNVGRVPETVGY